MMRDTANHDDDEGRLTFIGLVAVTGRILVGICFALFVAGVVVIIRNGF